jgi:hypothetical protein
MFLKIFHLGKNNGLPEVVLNPETGNLKIEGRCMPEDAMRFFLPIINWCQNYATEPKDSTQLTVSLEYFNSSSAKQLLLLFEALSGISEIEGKTLKILWLFEEDDDLIRMKGEEFRMILGDIIELVPYS